MLVLARKAGETVILNDGFSRIVLEATDMTSTSVVLMIQEDDSPSYLQPLKLGCDTKVMTKLGHVARVKLLQASPNVVRLGFAASMRITIARSEVEFD